MLLMLVKRPWVTICAVIAVMLAMCMGLLVFSSCGHVTDDFSYEAEAVGSIRAKLDPVIQFPCFRVLA